MKQTFYLILFIVFSGNCFSQNDTLYLLSESVVLNGETFNQKDNNGFKLGSWIDYHVDYLKIDVQILLASGDGFHEYSEIHTKYRALKENEYDGIQIPKKESIDTVDGDLYYDITYDEVHNKIPVHHYCIESIGKYENDLKQGMWEFQYCLRQLKKKIFYKNGLPVADFQIFRENGTLIINFVVINDSICEVGKYKENGTLIETLIDKTCKFKGLY